MERGWGRSQAGEFLLQLSLALKDFKDLFPLKKKKSTFSQTSKMVYDLQI